MTWEDFTDTVEAGAVLLATLIMLPVTIPLYLLGLAAIRYSHHRRVVSRRLK